MYSTMQPQVQDTLSIHECQLQALPCRYKIYIALYTMYAGACGVMACTHSYSLQACMHASFFELVATHAVLYICVHACTHMHIHMYMAGGRLLPLLQNRLLQGCSIFVLCTCIV